MSLAVIAGAVLAAIWWSRVLDAFFGMRHIPDISTPQWDTSPAPHLQDRTEVIGGAAPRVSMIVPARNEEQHVEAAVRSLLQLDYPDYEIVAVDDRSTDATGAILDRLAAERPELLRVIHVAELPADWLGKTHAMCNAAQQATGDWLLFTDADVIFRPDALRRAIAYAERVRADHLVVAPELQMHSPGERMMLGFFQIMFVFGHRPWKVHDPGAKDHIGVGAFNLVRRSVYEKIGTYRALRLSVLDDMKLGQLVKDSGFAQRYAFGRGLVTLRWAYGAFGVVANLTKNFFAILEYRVWKAVGFALLLLLFNLGPFAGVWLAPGAAKIGYGAALAAIACLYVGSSWHSQVTPQYFLLHPLAAALFVFTLLKSTVLTLWRGGVVWRGTKYSLEDLRREMVQKNS